jgi:hypothetical protein
MINMLSTTPIHPPRPPRPAPTSAMGQKTVSRCALEQRYGTWTDRDYVREDGQATRLIGPEDGGGLFLTCQGYLLAVEPAASPGHYYAHPMRGTPEYLWAQAQAFDPQWVPDSPLLSRYWELREAVSPHVDVFGMFDLTSFSVLQRSLDQADVVSGIERLNRAADVDRCL